MREQVISQTEFENLKLFNRGKVRDVYDLDDRLLIVTSDRISAFDVVLPNGIPGKGKVLNLLSCYWFAITNHIQKNHLITSRVADFPDICHRYRDVLEGRSMLVWKTTPVEIECVVRGYLSGSAWLEYEQTGYLAGMSLPGSLLESAKLPSPMFTPAIKSKEGHDENITIERMKGILGQDLTEKIIKISLSIFSEASTLAEEKGIIIADTKFEFGFKNEELLLIDEILTPDSSRFWPKDEYQPGKPQKSFDKQYVRDYLLTLDWNKTPPAPQLPEEVIHKTAEKYGDILMRLANISLSNY